MDNIKDILSLEYHGEPLSLGRMDSYQVGASIIAFSDFLGVIAKSTYGEKIELRTEIQGIRGDSFDIDFLLTVTAMTVQTTIIGAPIDFKDYFEIIKHAVKAWIHLRGEPPAAISQQGDNYKIENNYGQITYVNGLVVNIISDAKAAKAAEQFIRKPLEAGIEYLSIISPKLKDKTVVEKKDATSFKQIALKKPLIDTEAELGLQIQSPTFKEGNKWQFFDGQNSFYADIQDEDFLNSVSRGKRFGKGDLLIVRLRIKQSSSLGSLNIERIVIKVIKHVEALDWIDEDLHAHSRGGSCSRNAEIKVRMMGKTVLWIAAVLLAIPAIGLFTGGAVTVGDYFFGFVFVIGAVIFGYFASKK